MKKIMFSLLVLSALSVYGCSSSSSNSDAPLTDFSGRYLISQGQTVTGEMTIVQNGSSAALSYYSYDYSVVHTFTGPTHDETLQLDNILTGTGVGKVRRNKIDVTWENGDFTRLAFTDDAASFNGTGDAVFAGVKK